MDKFEPSEELIQRASDGDPSALAELLLPLRNRLESRIGFRLKLNPVVDFTADDVLQETYIDVCNGISTFQSTEGVSFSTWLFRVAENRLAKMLRDRSRLKRGGGRWAVDLDGSSVERLIVGLGDQAVTGSQYLSQQEVKHAIEVSLAILPQQQREAIHRFYLKQESLAEIASAMETTKDAVRGLIHRAKKSLRQSMGGSSRWFHRK